jgi:curli biogenesis system outer membrane secretion channel CsgG
MMRSFVLCMTAVLIVSLTACTPTVKLYRMKPAEINLSSYKKIAVGGISGQGGDEVGAILTQALLDSKQFEVMDREHLFSVMREHNLAYTGYFDSKTTAKLGKMIGSSALVFGKVLRRDYGQSESSGQSTCVDQHGRKSPCYIYTIKGTWKLDVDLQLIDVTTTKVLAAYTKPYSTSRENSMTNGHPDANWDVNQEFRELAEDAVKDFMKKIAPYKERVKVKIFTSSDLPDLAVGLKYAEQGDWYIAIDYFKAACENADRNPSIKPELRAQAHYDLGIAYGYSGMDYNKALEELRTAKNIYPDEVFYSEMDKIKQFMDDDMKLKKQGAGKKT